MTDHQLLPKDYQEALEAFADTEMADCEYLTIYEAHIKSALTRAASPSIPEGYALVPIEPTEEMLDAGYNAHSEIEKETAEGKLKHKASATETLRLIRRASQIYKAMINAAPQPQQSKEETK